MEAFNDPKVTNIVMVAASQVGKSEFLLNCIGYVIDQDPASTMYIQPTLDDARKFSRHRIAPMIRDSKPLRAKVSDVKTRDSGNTLLQKSFPGGMLTLTGSNTASALASTPVRYIFGDERDRWALSAGTEGDPWELAKARQTTFYNKKAVEVSTPTIKGSSNIEAAYYRGTQELWCIQCPHCGEWHNIDFDDIRFLFKEDKVGKKSNFTITSIWWICPSCGAISYEDEVRSQPAKWIAQNPNAYKNGVRSFWLNAFCSPWVTWSTIAQRFLEAKDDPEKLKVVYNTLFGKLWEVRGEIENEDEVMARREEYPADLPDGVLALTCGVDTQDNRLEYEVVGYGHHGEDWGIEKGMIMGRPDSEEVWEKLDGVIDRVYKFSNGKGLRISCTFVDSGGHYTQEVYAACKKRQTRRVFAIKGKGGPDIPFVRPPSRVPMKDNKKVCVWLYTLGVDAGKAKIMKRLTNKTPGRNYSHFPLGKGYDTTFFAGLVSERLILTRTRRGDQWVWEKIPGHERNEALDCRNYANAAFEVMHPDLTAIEKRLKGVENTAAPAAKKKPARPKKKDLGGDDW